MLSDDVYEKLKSLIMSSRVGPDQPLRIDTIARELGVSPTPVREALPKLESDGLVTRRGSRGWFTNPLISPEDFEDLWDFRLLSEPWAAARAAQRRTDADIAAIRAEMLNPAGAHETMDFSNYRAMQEHDQRFHALLFEISGNTTAREAFERTHVHVRTFRIRHASQLGHLGIEEHRVVADAVVDGDVRASRRAMEAHLIRSRKRLRPFVAAD